MELVIVIIISKRYTQSTQELSFISILVWVSTEPGWGYEKERNWMLHVSEKLDTLKYTRSYLIKVIFTINKACMYISFTLISEDWQKLSKGTSI